MTNGQLDLTHALISTAVAGDNVIVPSVPGKRIEIWQVFIYNVAAQALELRTALESLTGPLTAFPATSGLSLPFTGAPHFLLQPGAPFILRLGAATQVSGFVNYLLRD